MMGKDHLHTQVKDLPYFRALLRAVESRFYEDIELPGPVLDVGCGDGHFASVTFDRPLDVGIDPSRGALVEAKGRKAYRTVIESLGSELPYSDATFASAVSNSVLEHIVPVDEVLADVARVLKPGALFIVCVPNHRFDPNLSVGRALDRLRLSGLGNLYRSFFEKISRHVHLDPPEVWEERFENAGFTLEKSWDYFSPEALRALEWGHYFGLPSLITKRLTGRWLLSSRDWNLRFVESRLRKYYDEPVPQAEGAYSFFISRRRRNVSQRI